MAECLVINCDGCGAEKKATNHWFRARVIRKKLEVISAAGRRAAGSKDFCGMDCLLKYVAKEAGNLGKEGNDELQTATMD